MPTYDCPRCSEEQGGTIRKPNGRHCCPGCMKPLALSQGAIPWETPNSQLTEGEQASRWQAVKEQMRFW